MQLLKYMANSPVMSQAVLDHKSTVDFCTSAGLLKAKTTQLTLTSSGRHLLNLAKSGNPSYLIEFNPKECYFIVTNVFLNPMIPTPIGQTLSTYFESDDTKKTWSYSLVENPSLPDDFMEYLPALKQSKFLSERNGLLELNPEYSPLVSQLISTTKVVSGVVFEEILEQRKQIGREAEEFVVRFERKELRRGGCSEEAKLVTRISDWDVAAGYDVKSFRGPSLTKKHDKFIEVKGTSGADFRFYWSSNEIEKARVLRKQYWLYFIPNVFDVKRRRPIRIQDPFRRILKSNNFHKDPIGYEVKAKGELPS